MKTNYHTHTQRCRHAGGTEADYISSALGSGLSVLGFSDHAPFEDRDYGYRMPFEELDEYFSAVDLLSKRYKSDIIIKKSLEIEYMPRYMDYYERLYTKYGVDYLLLGEHFFDLPGGDILNITSARDTSDYLLYARAVEEALGTGLFQALAHPDLFAMNHFPWDDNCDRAVDIILDAAVRTGIALEFNANGYRRGVHNYPEGPRVMYPHIKLWEKVRGTDIPVIVGSDCHGPDQVWDWAMDRAYAELKKLGIQPLQELV